MTTIDEGKRTFTLEDLEGRTPDEIRDIIDVTKAQIRDLHQTETGELRSLNDSEKSALQILIKVHERAEALYEEHRNISKVLQRTPKAIEFSRLGGEPDDPYADVRRMTTKDTKDRALRRLESREHASHLTAAQKDQLDKAIRHNIDTARRILVTETEEYREAYMKMMTRPDAVVYLSQEEREALRAFGEYRAANETTTTAGGFGIPVKLAA